MKQTATTSRPRPTYIDYGGETRRRQLGLPPRTRRRNSRRFRYDATSIMVIAIITAFWFTVFFAGAYILFNR